jgi:hypothetical protein
MILDATAGNRSMWQTKDYTPIIYVDVERHLTRKPTIITDNTKTPFLNSLFDTIFYDPPHTWMTSSRKPSRHTIPDAETYLQHYDKKYGKTPRYYGWDKYDTRGALVAHIYHAFNEFKRILKQDGLLWFKWCDMRIPLTALSTVLNQWRTLMTIPVGSNSTTNHYGRHQTSWLCLAKVVD